MTAELLMDMIEARRQLYNISKLLEKKLCQPRILNLVKISLNNKRKIETLIMMETVKAASLLPWQYQMYTQQLPLKEIEKLFERLLHIGQMRKHSHWNG